MRLKGDLKKKKLIWVLWQLTTSTNDYWSFGAFMDFMAAPVFQVASSPNQLRDLLTTWHPICIEIIGDLHHLLAIKKSVCQGSPSSECLEFTHPVDPVPPLLRTPSAL